MKVSKREGKDVEEKVLKKERESEGGGGEWEEK